jgi:hypothetical protein
MDVDKISKWLTLIANFGVVAGIFFLAIEIRQNQSTLEQNQVLMERDYQLNVANGFRLAADAADKNRSLIIQDEEVAQIWLDGLEGKELTATNQYRFNQLCDMNIWNAAVLYERYRVLNDKQRMQALIDVTREQMEASAAFKSCRERNIDRLHSWGMGQFVDAVNSGTDQ